MKKLILVLYNEAITLIDKLRVIDNIEVKK